MVIIWFWLKDNITQTVTYLDYQLECILNVLNSQSIFKEQSYVLTEEIQKTVCISFWREFLKNLTNAWSNGSIIKMNYFEEENIHLGGQALIKQI